MLNSLDPQQLMAETVSRLASRVEHLESLPVLIPATPIFPTRATMWHDESIVTVGNVLSKNVSTVQMFAARTFQQPPANGDTFTNGFYLKAGTYTFVVLGESRADAGFLDWYIDTVKVVSLQDWYSAGTTQNVEKTASVAVTGDGFHLLKGVINGKNGSSGGHYSVLTKMYFRLANDVTEVN
jgi:hypothetical protein